VISRAGTDGQQRKGCWYTATMKVVLPPEVQQDGIRTLRSLVMGLRASKDCSECHIFEDIDEEGAFQLTERWSSLSALHRHLRSDGFRRLLAVMDLSARTPEFRVETVSHTEGVDLLALIRGLDE
jgi:quinol monooxygenase YgiN